MRILRKYQNGTGTSWPYAEFVQLRDGAKSTRVEASLRDATSFSTTAVSEGADTASLSFVSGGYLGILNSRVTLGRTLAPSDDVVGAPPVVVVSHATWTHRLGADPSIVGRPIWLNGAAIYGCGGERPRVHRHDGYGARAVGANRAATTLRLAARQSTGPRRHKWTSSAASPTACRAPRPHWSSARSRQPFGRIGLRG